MTQFAFIQKVFKKRKNVLQPEVSESWDSWKLLGSCFRKTRRPVVRQHLSLHNENVDLSYTCNLARRHSELRSNYHCTSAFDSSAVKMRRKNSTGSLNGKLIIRTLGQTLFHVSCTWMSSQHRKSTQIHCSSSVSYCYKAASVFILERYQDLYCQIFSKHYGYHYQKGYTK